MEEFFKEKIKYFLGGAIAGGVPSCYALFSAPLISGNIIVEYTARFFGTIIIAFSSGFVTVLSHDLYKYIKERVKNRKNKK